MEKNLTQGREWRVILLFALPMMGSMLLQVLYNLADTVIVSRFVGPSALGAVGLTGSMVWLLLTVCTGTGTGTSIVVAQYYGAGRHGDVQTCVGAAYALALLLGAGMTLLCLLGARPMIWGFLSAPRSMREMSLVYFYIYAGGIVFQMLYNITYGLLRAHGDSRGALLFLLASSVLNVGLDLWFVIGLGWGVAGAAAATVISQAACALISMAYMTRGFPHLRPRASLGPAERGQMRTIARVSAPIVIQHGISALGFTVLQRLINSFGPASIEGYAAMGRIEQIAHIPSKSFNAAVSAFVGQNVGAKKICRAQAGYRWALLLGGALTLAISVAIIVFSRPALSLFGISGESMRRGREHLILLMSCSLLVMSGNITSGFLQGAGDVRVPAVAGFADLSVRLLCAHIMALTILDFRSVYLSMPPAWITGCLIVVMRYRSGAWRRHALVE